MFCRIREVPPEVYSGAAHHADRRRYPRGPRRHPSRLHDRRSRAFAWAWLRDYYFRPLRRTAKLQVQRALVELRAKPCIPSPILLSGADSLTNKARTFNAGDVRRDFLPGGMVRSPSSEITARSSFSFKPARYLRSAAVGGISLASTYELVRACG